MSKVNLEDCCEILDSKRVPITATNRKSGPYPYYGANGIQDYVADYIFDEELVLLAEDGGNFNSTTKPIAYRVSGKCWVNNHAHVLKPLPIIDVDYLCYSLMFYKVGNLVNGATREKLTQAAMRKMQVHLRPMPEQINIVSTLRKTQRIIAYRRTQLAKLDELVKCRFVEMEAKWKKCTTKGLLKSFLHDITYGFTNPMPDSTNGPWKITAKDIVGGLINFKTARKTDILSYNALTAKSKPAIGDVLLTKDGTLGRTAIVTTDNICVNQSVAVLKCNERLLPEFLSLLLQLPYYQEEMLKNAGGGTIKHIYITRIVDMIVTIPDIATQREFITFVRRIDKLRFIVEDNLSFLSLVGAFCIVEVGDKSE